MSITKQSKQFSDLYSFSCTVHETVVMLFPPPPRHLRFIELISSKKLNVNLNTVHGAFTNNAVTFTSKIRNDDSNAPHGSWENVFDDGTKDRFIKNDQIHVCSIAYMLH